MPRTRSWNLLGGFSFRAFRRRAGFLHSDGFLRGYCLLWFVPRIAGGSFFDIAAAIARDLGKKLVTDDGTRFFDGDVFRGSVLIAMLDEQPRFSGAAAPAVRAHQHPGALQLFAVKTDLEVALCERGVHVGRFRRPGAFVPDHHGAATIFTLGDDAFETGVLDGMIL